MHLTCIRPAERVRESERRNYDPGLHWNGASNASAVEMVAGVGIEPTTRGFSIRCSTN
jgi:hypothetical protein